MKTKPQRHQFEIFETTKDKEFYGYLLEQGLGKTKITIDVGFHLHSKGELDCVLVLAPNGVHLNWLYEEMPKHAWHDVPMAGWRSNARVKEKRALEAIQEAQGEFRWLFMNIEAIRSQRGFKFAEKFVRSGHCLLVVDESTVIKSPKALQTKAALRLSRLSKYRRILTGTPITQGPLDFFTQSSFLHPNALPFTSYTAYKRTFAVEQTMSMGNRSFNKVVGYRNLDYLKSTIKSYTIRLEKEDCTDLPKKIYNRHHVELTPQQESLYRSIKETQVAMLEQEQAETGMVSVTSVLAALAKLHQVCCGFVIDDDGKIHDVPNNRFNALEVLTEDQGEKYVIWCHFRHSVESVYRYFNGRYGKGCAVHYYGGTPAQDRPEAVRAFNSRDGVRFFIANRAASKGITLTSACRAIYFANSYSLEDRLQSEDRIHRIGQERTCFYTDLLSHGTVEENVIKSLSLKKELSDKVLTSDWKRLINVTN